MTQPYRQDQFFKTEFEQFVRSCSYSPCHPIIRTFPRFKYDHLAEQSKTRRDLKKAAEAAAVANQLRTESERLGKTCNKYKTRQRALTPGLFTVFCGGCGVCLSFEMMPVCESPVTAFRTFAHRAWRRDDFATFQEFTDTGKWNDSI